ncbi:MAG: hypothetical protein ACHQ50_15510 [Fimbriimonadales bacterium]
MALRFVLDENLRGAPWWAIQHHNLHGVDWIDALRVGDPSDLPLGSDDPFILLWAEREGRVLVSFDRSSLPVHPKDRLAAGHGSPGIFLIRPQCRIPHLIAFLSLAAYAGDEAQWVDQITYIS